MSNTKTYFHTQKTHQLIAIGYWHSIFETDFPDPAWFRDADWSVAEKNRVLSHLQNSHLLEDWKGKSWCRFRCGETNMGSSDLTDGVYIYPEGLAHYLEAHQVRLPEQFIRHVQACKPIEINFGLHNCTILDDWWKSQQGWNKRHSSFSAPNDALIESYKNSQQGNL